MLSMILANAGVSPISMQNLVTLAAMTGGTNNLQVSPNSEYSKISVHINFFLIYYSQN